MSSIKAEFRNLLALEAIFEGGRMLVGGISTGYLLQHGLRPDQIALLKTIQAVVLFAAEVPTGLFADSLGRRLSLLTAALFSAAGLTIFALGSKFWHFSVAEIMTALSLCFWSGTYEAYVADSDAMREHPELLIPFFQRCDAVSQVSVMIAGLAGGLIAGNSLRNPYFAAISVQVFLALLLLRYPESSNSQSATRFKSLSDRITKWKLEMRSHMNDLRGSFVSIPAIMPLTISLIALQFFIQPILHYWPVALLESGQTPNPAFLSYVFAASCLAGALANGWLSGSSSKLNEPSRRLPFYSGLLILIGYCLLGSLPGFFSKALSIVLSLAGVSVLRAMLTARLTALAYGPSCSSVISGVNFVSRIGMIASLGLIQLWLRFLAPDQSPVKSLFQFYAGLAVVISASILALNFMITKLRIDPRAVSNEISEN